eukprot:COSAG02_NODE_4421_length_5377_cov_4.815839_5_plen_169_part_00
MLWDDDGSAGHRAVGAGTLVVGLQGAGELFVRHCLCGGSDAKRVGVMVLPQAGDINRLPATAEEAAEEPGATIISRAGDTLLVGAPVGSTCTCRQLLPLWWLTSMWFAQQEIPAETANAWASALLSAMEVTNVVVLDAQPIHTFFTVSWSQPCRSPGFDVCSRSLLRF